jgi:hypothetical protein
VKIAKRRLNLTRLTIADLSAGDLSRVVGGRDPDGQSDNPSVSGNPSWSCFDLCPGTVLCPGTGTAACTISTSWVA